VCALAAAVAGCFALSLGDEPFVCGENDLCPTGYECVFDVCTRKGKPDAALADAGAEIVDASCAADDFLGCVDGTHAQVCNGDGTGILEVECPGGCDAGAELCVRCTPNTVSCVGDVLTTCGPRGDVTDTQTCHAGCDATAPATCFTLVPANLPSTACDHAELEDVQIQQDREYDTTSCESFGGVLVTQGPDLGVPAICYLRVRRLIVETGVRVKITGPSPLAVVALERISLFGTIDLSGDGSTSGAGSVFLGVGSSGGDNSHGGGGAGSLSAGAHGGSGVNGSGTEKPQGGPAYGDETLSPLTGGSPGGHGGTPCTGPVCIDGPVFEGGGGGGGGGLQLVACEQLTLGQLARINAGGGGGPAGQGNGIASPPSGGGGGGSGGTIFVEAPSILVPNGTKVTAPGGGGGGGGAGFEAGDPGGDADDEAPGLPGGAPDGGGAGGRGGVGSNLGVPTAGDDARATGDGGGGGGGGSAGRIRLNARPDLAITVSPGARVVPTPIKATISRKRATP